MDEPVVLEKRELSVLLLWAVQRKEVEIAELLKANEHTIDRDLRIIYRKMGVNSRQCCIHIGWFTGIIKKEYFTDDGKDVLAIYLEY